MPMLTRFWVGLMLMAVAGLVTGCAQPGAERTATATDVAATDRAGEPAANTAAPASLPGPKSQGPPLPGAAAAEPDYITVQHILIGFQGSVPGKEIQRSKAEAAALANQVLAQARSGEKSFDVLVSEYTDDAYPGVYAMANFKISPATLPQGVYPRGGMVPAFGDVGFPLQVGEVGLAEYDPSKSKYGWHVIKRVK